MVWKRRVSIKSRWRGEDDMWNEGRKGRLVICCLWIYKSVCICVCIVPAWLSLVAPLVFPWGHCPCLRPHGSFPPILSCSPCIIIKTDTHTLTELFTIENCCPKLNSHTALTGTSRGDLKGPYCLSSGKDSSVLGECVIGRNSKPSRGEFSGHTETKTD